MPLFVTFMFLWIILLVGTAAPFGCDVVPRRWIFPKLWMTPVARETNGSDLMAHFKVIFTLC